MDAARRDPERRFADGRAGETEIAGDLIAKQMAEQIDFEKSAILSDHGAGEKLICGENHDAETNEIENDNQNFVYLMVFEGMLTLCGYDRLLPIVEQIVKNGRNRKESIAALSIERRKKLAAAKRFYDRGVRVLTNLISPNKIKG